MSQAARGVLDAARHGSLVLGYHAVSDDWPCSLAVTPAALERQVSLLLRRGFTPATFTQAALAHPERRTFAVTFDDAFLSVLRLARPVLAALGVPATVFAPTAFMGRRQPLRWAGIDHWHETAHAGELESMDWSDLRQLAGEGWEIGSHTHTHPHLTRLDDAALRRELVRSRQACAEQLDRPCRSLAYPYGDADGRVARQAAEAGYEAAVILASRPGRLDPHLHPRTGVYRVDAGWRFRLKLSPAGRLLRDVKALRGRR